MPKYSVDFYIRHYNGSIEVDADNPREAQLIIENARLDRLEQLTSSVEVYVEEVHLLDSAPDERDDDED
jgi:hypothetical protein